MSSNKLNFSSKENFSLKRQLNEIWKQFMSSFGYEKYYNSKELNQKYDSIYNSTLEQNNRNCIFSTKLFFQFLSQNSITISENNISHILTSNNKKGLYLLSEPKIWIMYIIFIDQKLKIEKNKILIIINLFKEALKYNCDIISLFEFFLIYISKISYDDFFIVENKNILEIIPKEFIILYNKKKSILKTIFCKDNNDYLCTPIYPNFVNTQSTIFSTDNQINNEFIFENNGKNNEFKLEEEKKEIKCFKNNNRSLDLNNVVIICKDYLNKGFFAIFKEKKNLKEKENDDIIKNPFINYESNEDEDEQYYLMPLLNKYIDYEQKMEANKILILLGKSIYQNYTYFPYDINIITKL